MRRIKLHAKLKYEISFRYNFLDMKAVKELYERRI